MCIVRSLKPKVNQQFFMFQSNKLNLLTAIILTGVLLTGCDLSQQDPVPPAQAGINLEFFYAGSGEPVVDAPVEVSAVFEGQESSVPQGELFTGSEGEIEGFISNPEEVTITQLDFIITEGGDEYTFQEGVTLELRRAEPFDSVDFTFEVDTTSTE